GEEEAEAKRDPSGTWGKGGGRRGKPQPGKKHGEPDDGANDRHGEHVGAGDEHDLARDVGAGERGGGEQGRADLRQTGARVRGRGLVRGGVGCGGTTWRAIRAGTQRRGNGRGAKRAPHRAAVPSWAGCGGAALPLSGSSLPGGLALGRWGAGSRSRLSRTPCR